MYGTSACATHTKLVNVEDTVKIKIKLGLRKVHFVGLHYMVIQWIACSWKCNFKIHLKKMVCDFASCHVCSWLLLSRAFLLVVDLQTTSCQNILHVRSCHLLSLAIELNHYLFKLDYIRFLRLAWFLLHC